MTREEQIRQASIEYTFLRGTPMCLGGDAFAELNELNRNYAFEEGAKWADKTMIDKACKWLYCIDSYIECSNPMRDEIVRDLRKYLEE